MWQQLSLPNSLNDLFQGLVTGVKVIVGENEFFVNVLLERYYSLETVDKCSMTKLREKMDIEYDQAYVGIVRITLLQSQAHRNPV